MPPLMTDQQRSDWFTIPEMARRLGVSEATLKRRRADGRPVKLPTGDSVEMEWEMLERPQGHEYRARVVGALPPLRTAQESLNQEGQPSDQERPPTPPTGPPAATMRALEILAETSQALTRQVVAQAETIREQAGTIGQLRERAEALAVERAAAKLEVDDLRERLEQERRRPWWKRLVGRE